MIVVIEAPLDEVMEMDAILELLMKIKPDNCPIDNKSWVDISTGIDNERSGVRIERSDELEIGAKGCLVRIRFENNNMKVRRGTNYASLIEYNYDIKHGRNKNIRPKAQKSFDGKPVVALNLLDQIGKEDFTNDCIWIM
ncbi:31407_t:CDS:2 [Gigaspora margarita]|uniref:31407_t:CDS:1 n=1 Tax=Gigaspora margarita TaxID=4874 RepID=A0ABN7W1N5_GIGMA|nr:31407_t:CDS:2 [Gigaspora margarita]